MQGDLPGARRTVNENSRSGVVERHVPTVPLGQEEQHVLTGRWERRAGRAGHFPRAQTRFALDLFVDGASRNHNLDIAANARVALVE
jgi:hypothetical protein